MPGEVQHSLDSLVVEAKRLVSLGVPGLILFGVPARKDAAGERRLGPRGRRAGRAARRARRGGRRARRSWPTSASTSTPTTGTAASSVPTGEVLNDPTLELYQRIALAQAEAGADVVAPSGMMDGQVAAIRAALDGGGHEPVAILAYAVQVRLRALRPLPRRGRRHHRRRRRPPRLPAGPAQRARGAGRNCAGRGRGRRHDHGQAGDDVARRAGRRALGGLACRWPPTT